MHWRRKATVTRICAAMPFGDHLYRALQRRFGGLSHDPSDRLSFVPMFAQWVRDAGGSVENATIMEVGTGHKPTIPIGFYLLGAKAVYTYDLHRRLDIPVVRGSIGWLAEHRDQVHSLLEPFVDRAALNERLDLLARHASDPLESLEQAGIRYVAPGDASRTGLAAESVDIHYSITTLEHIPAPTLSAIMREAHRVLKPEGVAVHFVDLSDHFSHDDPSISAINFLRFSNEQWARLGGNEFAYTNRLRASQLAEIYRGAGFDIVRETQDKDDLARRLLSDGFPLHEDFARFTADDVVTIHVNSLLRKARRE
jgi:SAM-dependent methyltransferase